MFQRHHPDSGLGPTRRALQAGKHIKFSLYSFWRCQDGTAGNGVAEGVIALKGRTAVYKQTDPAYSYTLTFHFSPSACTVDCEKPDHFGGFNVDPTGTYRKVSSRAKFD